MIMNSTHFSIYFLLLLVSQTNAAEGRMGNEYKKNMLVTPRREPDGADGITSPTVPHTSATSRRATESDMVLSPKIIDGVPSPLNLYPWFASTTTNYYGYLFLGGCGGALITPEYVLTAAHCFVFPDDGEVRIPSDGFRIGNFDTSDFLNGGQVSRCPPPRPAFHLSVLKTERSHGAAKSHMWFDLLFVTFALLMIRRLTLCKLALVIVLC
jgi:hypothetical protein